MTNPPDESGTKSSSSGGTVLCVHEDRRQYLTGVKLAILGLARHDPSLRVLVHCPGAPEAFTQWLREQPNACPVDLPRLGASGWNVKAAVLLKLLESHDEAIWMDSDILVTRPIAALVTGIPQDVLVATEETYWGQRQGGTFRTTAWGLQTARVLPATVNSGVLRVTRTHVPLLKAWQTMMAHPVYLQAQANPWYARPLHMIGDQEVLTGLLGASEFAHIPVRLLRRGVDIAQSFGPAGVTPGERLHAVRRGCPAFIHTMGQKPWQRADSPRAAFERGHGMVGKLRGYYEFLALDVSPYSLAAVAHAGAMKEPTDWMQPRSLPGRAFTALTGGSVFLAGMPLAIFDHLVRFARRRLGIARYAEDPRYVLVDRPF
jgi:hypothetical protein